MNKEPIVGVVLANKAILNWVATRFLIKSLNKKNVTTKILYPSSEINLDEIDALLFWEFGGIGQRQYLSLYNKLGPIAKERGVPIFPSQTPTLTHSQYFTIWENNNIKCSKHKLINSIGDLENIPFDYPLILRMNHKSSTGKHMYLVNNIDEAKSIWVKYKTNLATEYFDVRSGDGYYRKYRTIVVGDKVMPQQVTISKDWKISFMSATPEADKIAISETKELRSSKRFNNILTQAVKSTGLYYGAFDYSIKDDKIIIWEVNRLPAFLGIFSGKKNERLRKATGNGSDEWRVFWETYTDSIVDLIVAEALKSSKDIRYLFWTGGVDSTYRLIELVLDGHTVQPIYISDKIDIRRNSEQELKTMEKLIKVINDFTTAGKVLPLKNIKTVPESNKITELASIIGYGPSYKKRMGSQYEALCRFADSFPHPIEIGIEIGGRAEKLLRNRVSGAGGDCKIDANKIKDFPELKIYSNMRFPLIHLTKRNIYNKAQSMGVIKILKDTFTCWYPKAGMTHCGRCEMCRARRKMGLL